MNTKLLKEIQKAILQEPRRLNMNTFYSGSHDTPCGTVSCIAGHAVIIHALKKKKKTFEDKDFVWGVFSAIGWCDVGDEAKVLLDIDNEQAERLFYVENWPTLFRKKYDLTNSLVQLGKITVARIERFIKTKGQK